MAMMETSKGICSRIANPVTVEEGLELSLNITPELLPELIVRTDGLAFRNRGYLSAFIIS